MRYSRAFSAQSIWHRVFPAAAVLVWAGCSPEAAPPDLVVNPGELMGEAGADTVTSPPPPMSGGGMPNISDGPPTAGCGNGLLEGDEACDDANLEDGDGCAGNCRGVEEGYVCGTPGGACELAEVCGDARVVGTEACDDGNEEGNDGCSASCQVEAGFVCPEPGQACVSTVVCGDSAIALGETCDDGNLVAGDGCSDACQLEEGWECLIVGARCRPVCGDGALNGAEQCDDGNQDSEDGCSVNCVLEPGFVCPTPGEDCRETVCQDGVREGSEQCDDGNDVPYDGCSADCTREPVCGDGLGEYQCAAVCGDGMKFPEEACDDGNTNNDDGCSAECQLELGFSCVDAAADLGDALALPIIYRDFTAQHPQFEIDPLQSPRLPGIVQSNLVDGKPAYNPNFQFTFQGQTRPWTMDGPGAAASGGATLNAAQIAQRFAEWYSSAPNAANPELGNVTIIDDLVLEAQPNQSFQFAASIANDAEFFPLDELGFDDTAADTNGVLHNFYFTSEVRQWFEFQGGESLVFTGDDDVWVFVNGQLTVDLGGIHGEIEGSITLSNDGLASELCLQDEVGGAIDCGPLDVPVFADGVNEIVVFQAERHVTESNYTLTLQGFNAPVTSCQSVCGDGEITADETCDDGENNGAGYNFCGTNCLPGPRCGDAILDEGEEECDNGFNLDGYATDADACAPGCVRPSSCGDGVLDGSFGEECDLGAEQNTGAYGGCTASCRLGPRCGDGEVNGQEQCDDGNRVNNDGCNVNCFRERLPI